MAGFVERYADSMAKHGSILCVGIDPAIPGQRRDKTIPNHFLRIAGLDDAEARLAFSINLLGNVSKYASAAKPNSQYFFGLSPKEHADLAHTIHDHGLVSIYDCKLADIGDSVESRMHWMGKCGYDAITVSAQFGNLSEIVKYAHRINPPLGVLAVTLPSNPESQKYFKQAAINGTPVYLAIAEEIRDAGADGCVVGATFNATSEEIKAVRDVIGDERMILFVGVGAQGGDEKKCVANGGKQIAINVGRDIIYDADQAAKAAEWNRLFNEARKMYA